MAPCCSFRRNPCHPVLSTQRRVRRMKIKELFTNKPRCQHTSKNGSPCQADPQTGKPYCFFHDPEQQQKRATARKHGGKVRSGATEKKTSIPPNLPPKSLEPPPNLPPLHQQTINQLLREKI